MTKTSERKIRKDALRDSAVRAENALHLHDNYDAATKQLLADRLRDCMRAICAFGTPPEYGTRKELGNPVGYVDRLTGHARFCRLNDLEHVPSNTKVYAVPDPAIKDIRRSLQTMINSAQVFGDGEVVTGYKIMTGALHRVIGVFADADEPLTIPVNLSPAPPTDASASDQQPADDVDWKAEAEKWYAAFNKSASECNALRKAADAFGTRLRKSFYARVALAAAPAPPTESLEPKP